MIELPDDIAPTEVEWQLVDAGGVLRSPMNGELQRVNRPGTRLQLRVVFPPLSPERSRIFVNRLMRAVQEGLRMEIPDTAARQGAPGLAVTVDGAVAGGTSLPLKGLPVGYAAREGWWLSPVDASGNHYAHTLTAPFTADGSGEAVASVWPPLRSAFADGDAVLLARPMIEGFVTDEALTWQLNVRHHTSIGFTLEERR